MPFIHSLKKRSTDQRKFGIARQVEGVVSNDSAPFTYATYDPLVDDNNTGILPGYEDTDPVTGVFLGGAKYDTLLIGVCFTGTGSVRIQPMIGDPELERWIPLVDATGAVIKSPALTTMSSAGGLWECWCYGDRLFFMVQDKSGDVSDLEILVRPGRSRVPAFYG
jgi:hypothetical protein